MLQDQDHLLFKLKCFGYGYKMVLVNHLLQSLPVFQFHFIIHVQLNSKITYFTFTHLIKLGLGSEVLNKAIYCSNRSKRQYNTTIQLKQFHCIFYLNFDFRQCQIWKIKAFLN